MPINVAPTTMSVQRQQQQQHPAVCSGSANASFSGSLPGFPLSDQDGGSTSASVADDSFPPLPDHFPEPLEPPGSLLPPSPPLPPASESRTSVTLEEGATLVYCAPQKLVNNNNNDNKTSSGVDNGVDNGINGGGSSGITGVNSGGVTSCYETKEVKEGIRRLTDKYAAPETLSLLRNTTTVSSPTHFSFSPAAVASTSQTFSYIITSEPLRTTSQPQHATYAGSSAPETLSPASSSLVYPASSSYPVSGQTCDTLVVSPTPSVTLPASSSPSVVLPLPLQSNPAITTNTFGAAAGINGGADDMFVEMRPKQLSNTSSFNMSSSASAEFRQNLNLRLSQKHITSPPGLAAKRQNHVIQQNHVAGYVTDQTSHVTDQTSHVTDQTSHLIDESSHVIDQTNFVDIRKPSPSHVIVQRLSVRNSGGGGRISPLTLTVPAFSDASSDVSDTSAASPTLITDSARHSSSSVTGVGVRGKGFLQSVRGLPVAVSGGVEITEGVTDTDVQQVEMFYKSHKTEVTVCRCLANLYIGGTSSSPSISLQTPPNAQQAPPNPKQTPPISKPTPPTNGSAATNGSSGSLAPSGQSEGAEPHSSGSESWEFVTTGIPTLVLDSGEHHRARQLSIVVAEKGTGFGLWRDAVSHLTRYTCPHANFHTLSISTDRGKRAGLSFDDSQAAAEFAAAVLRLTSNPEDELLNLSKKGKWKKKKSFRSSEKKKTKYKPPKKTDISQPCCFQHVTKLEVPQMIVGTLPLPPGSFPPAPSGSVGSLSDIMQDKLSIGRARSQSSELSEGSAGTGLSSER